MTTRTLPKPEPQVFQPNPAGTARSAEQIAIRRLKKHARVANKPLREYARAAAKNAKDSDNAIAKAWLDRK